MNIMPLGRHRPALLATLLVCALSSQAHAGETCTGASGASAPRSGAFACGTNAQAAGFEATATGNAASAAGDFATATGTQSNASGNAAVAIGARSDAEGLFSVALGADSLATQTGSVALGSVSKATGTLATAVGDHAAAVGNSTAIGALANASAANSVAIGTSSAADRANTVSVGSANAQRQIVNVADATEATDAINLRQAQAGNAQTLSQANAYTDARVNEVLGVELGAFDDRFDRIENRVSSQDVRISRVGALSAAMIGMTASAAAVDEGDTRIGLAAGSYEGKEALSIGVQRRFGARTAVTLGGAFSGSERSGTVGVGVGF